MPIKRNHSSQKSPMNATKRDTSFGKSLPKTWIWGKHSVTQALKAAFQGKRDVLEVWVTEDKRFLIDECASRLPVRVVSGKELQDRLPPQAVHQGMAAVVSGQWTVDFSDVSPEGGLILALDHVIDPQNVGALWRSAAVFQAQAVMMTSSHSPSLEGSLAKAACGALECVPYLPTTNLVQGLEKLKKRDFVCVGLCETGKELNLSDVAAEDQGIVLVLGSEGDGLRRLTRENCDWLWRLPVNPCFSTLNVSSAGAIGLYALHEARNRSKG